MRDWWSRRLWWGGLALVALVLIAASPPAEALPQAATTPPQPLLRLATTRAVLESGLLDLLLPDFQRRTGYTVHAVAPEASHLLERGAVEQPDVFLIDAPAAEAMLLQTGAAIDSRPVLYGDFVLAGPAPDPAQVAGRAILPALQAIAASGATFVSRRDGSDGNVFELELWQAAMGRDVQHEGWYVGTHGDMVVTLNEAARRHAYTLSDRATYLTRRDGLQLRVLVEQDAALRDVYHVLRANPLQWPGANAAGAQTFADYLVSDAGRRLIAAAGIARYGQPLFVPDGEQD